MLVDRATERSEILDGLHAAECKAPEAFAVVETNSYELDLYVDSAGEDAALVTVVLRDRPDGELYDWSALAPIRDAIVAAFQEKGIARWPYVAFRLVSEAPGSELADAS